MLRKAVNTIVPKSVTRAQLSTASQFPVVNSHNEFDPLEEVIVGRVEGSTIPEWHVSGKAVWPNRWWDMYKTKAGQPFPKELIDKG
jgi:glycine amidinotransferase